MRCLYYIENNNIEYRNIRYLIIAFVMSDDVLSPYVHFELKFDGDGKTAIRLPLFFYFFEFFMNIGII